MSHLMDFYRGNQCDSEQRMLSDIWAWDDAQFEHTHDFIQWMFPLDEPSGVNADAPLVTADDVKAFKEEPLLIANMARSFTRFIAFLGLKWSPDEQLVRADNFETRLAIWKYPNHNWLRITRVLKSLRLLGFDHEAVAFWMCLKRLHDEDRFEFANSFAYWEDTATESP